MAYWQQVGCAQAKVYCMRNFIKVIIYGNSTLSGFCNIKHRISIYMTWFKICHNLLRIIVKFSQKFTIFSMYSNYLVCIKCKTVWDPERVGNYNQLIWDALVFSIWHCVQAHSAISFKIPLLAHMRPHRLSACIQDTLSSRARLA